MPVIRKSLVFRKFQGFVYKNDHIIDIHVNTEIFFRNCKDCNIRIGHDVRRYESYDKLKPGKQNVIAAIN